MLRNHLTYIANMTQGSGGLKGALESSQLETSLALGICLYWLQRKLKDFRTAPIRSKVTSSSSLSVSSSPELAVALIVLVTAAYFMLNRP